MPPDDPRNGDALRGEAASPPAGAGVVAPRGRRAPAFAGHTLSVREVARAQRWMRVLTDPDLTDAEALPLAQRLAEVYQRLDASGRLDYQRAMAGEFGDGGRKPAPAGARVSRRMLLLKRFNLLERGLRFLVDLRADVLEALPAQPDLAALQDELEALLSAWFDVGLLEMRRLTWDSPASLLEKLVHYEAVHAIASWMDLKNRLDSDRRVYAFFHPRLADEPLIFVEVALGREMADSVAPLLDEAAPVEDPRRAKTAIFYSISNTQRGLRGLAFGNFLLKRVIADLKRDVPRLKTFATLSPIPGLRAWLGRQPAAALEPLAGDGWPLLQAAGGLAGLDRDRLLGMSDAEADPLRGALLRLTAHYLTRVDGERRPLDPVARFHLGNGARLERLNWRGDPSDKGWRQSYGVMVNYLYDPARLDRQRAQLAQGRPATGSAIADLLRAEPGR